jgi:hypothetical protein
MRPTTKPAVLIAFALVACANPDSTAGPENAATPAATGASLSTRGPTASRSLTRRPFSGRCETEFAPPPFPLPPAIRQVDTGTCQLAHLGRTAFYDEHDISFATGRSISVEIRFTAANGDVLRATSVGTFVPDGPGVRINAAMTFSGGTGRFANAVGEARLVGQADFTTNSARFSFVDGWIAYAPADRSGS